MRLINKKNHREALLTKLKQYSIRIEEINIPLINSTIPEGYHPDLNIKWYPFTIDSWNDHFEPLNGFV